MSGKDRPVGFCYSVGQVRTRRVKVKGWVPFEITFESPQQAADAVKTGIEEGLRRRNAQAAVLAPG